MKDFGWWRGLMVGCLFVALVGGWSSATPALAAASSAPEIAIITTSEPHTSCTGDPPCIERVAVGEIVRYRLSVLVAEGTSTNLRLTDHIPAGMRFLNDGTATVALVANAGGMASSSLSNSMPGCAGLEISGNARAVWPTCPLPAANISGGPFKDSTDPTFALGDITNADGDADDEYAVVAFNALVTNIASNGLYTTPNGDVLGRRRDNDFSVTVNAATPETAAAAPTTLAEAAIGAIHTSVQAPPSLDAGDTLTYTLTFTNTPYTTFVGPVYAIAAFDVALADTLDANIVPQSITGSISGGDCGATPALFTGSVNSQTVSGSATCLNPGSTATITITARLANTVISGQSIPVGAASLQYSSLPGSGTPVGPHNATGSSTPGASGTATGERDGADGANGSLNHYASSGDSASTEVAAPQFSMAAPAPAVPTIGDVASYDLLVTLPEGRVRGLAIQDTLPEGLVYTGYQIITAAAGSAGSMSRDYSDAVPVPTFTAPDGTNTLAFTWDEINSTADNMLNNRFVLRIQARVPNAAAFIAGRPLPNSATLRFTPGGGASVSSITGGTVQSIIGEPQITTALAVNPADAVLPGAALTYTARFANTGSSTAYGVSATVTLPPQAAYSAGSARCTATNAAGTTTPLVVSATANAGTLLLAGPGDGWTLAASTPAAITCSYSATLQPDAMPGAHASTIDADWRSQATASANTRVYDDTTASNPGMSQDGTQDSATATFTARAAPISQRGAALFLPLIKR